MCSGRWKPLAKYTTWIAPLVRFHVACVTSVWPIRNPFEMGTVWASLPKSSHSQSPSEITTEDHAELDDKGLSEMASEKAISEIDVESRKRFADAYEKINIKFREMFKTLFGGGVGEMRLTGESNLSDSGIEIVSSAPADAYSPTPRF